MRHIIPHDWIALAQGAARQDQPDASELRRAQLPWLPDVIDWLYNTVARAHPQLQRSGALCPFVPPALDRDLLFLTVAENITYELPAMVGYLERVRDTFLATPPSPPQKDAVYKSLLVVFPEVPSAQPDLLKQVRIAFKPSLLEYGVTCGEFYPTNEDRSVRNTEYRIAESPVHLIALRYLTPHDDLFLKSQPDLYPIFLQRMKGQPDAD